MTIFSLGLCHTAAAAHTTPFSFSRPRESIAHEERYDKETAVMLAELRLPARSNSSGSNMSNMTYFASFAAQEWSSGRTVSEIRTPAWQAECDRSM